MGFLKDGDSGFWMVFACVAPLLAVVALPFLGVRISGGTASMILISGMAALHLWMMFSGKGRHSHDHGGEEGGLKEEKEEEKKGAGRHRH